MKTIAVGEFKGKFSEVIAKLKKGEEIGVTYGKKKEIVAYFKPKIANITPAKRKLEMLEGKATVFLMMILTVPKKNF